MSSLFKKEQLEIIIENKSGILKCVSVHANANPLLCLLLKDVSR